MVATASGSDDVDRDNRIVGRRLHDAAALRERRGADEMDVVAMADTEVTLPLAIFRDHGAVGDPEYARPGHAIGISDNRR